MVGSHAAFVSRTTASARRASSSAVAYVGFLARARATASWRVTRMAGVAGSERAGDSDTRDCAYASEVERKIAHPNDPALQIVVSIARTLEKDRDYATGLRPEPELHLATRVPRSRPPPGTRDRREPSEWPSGELRISQRGLPKPHKGGRIYAVVARCRRGLFGHERCGEAL